ncbi:hypothetical protein COV20_01290 [Candidatus Woesearchaeota archaeon CG10_big_fil_rev_8_21_14_0_10_45_16]|nr:MAG: hypothetical protein COV20_01290 [Candidatus Woesearchaeota archaeon CG10_big_fil_rev_8_21_14_0_10_45_16]
MKADVEVWLKQANRDYKSATNSLKSNDYYVACLLSQQAVEKALKFLHLLKGKELLRIHDLVKLAREINAPDDLIEKCAKINPVYVEVRYPEGSEMPAEKVNKKEAQEILELSREILRWVKKQI